MPIAESARLRIRRLRDDDAPFIVELLNTPGFLRHIGDRQVRNVDDALRYLQAGPYASHARYGHGLDGVELKAGGALIGMCGLLQRDALDAPDIGYAFLPAFAGQGYASEAAAAVLRHGRDVLGIGRIVAIVSPGNAASIRVLEKLGLRGAGGFTLPGRPPGLLFVPPD
ncbi:GNAT family N-acetyltransferase [Solimonas soli]|uniref:GNAT family N-acetyltransferase n=1 Tax=Solimonas soli TaxID=413479 RepID=UPI0004BC7FEB|nr:GNAT family N-acetyltransferase [Solimonas soli]